jgi:Mn2+/Fe2+ NRAMP family transporter
MRTLGQAILFLILLVGLFLIVVSVVLLIWASQPDSFDFNGLFSEAGVICLPIGIGFVVASVVFLRRPGASSAERDPSRQSPPSASR